MKLTNKQYNTMVQQYSPPSPTGKNCAMAFLVGGGICTLGQALQQLYVNMGVSQVDAPTWVSVTLVALSAVLTGLGLYDKIAKHAGAGTLVPITGFAKSVVSPAVEFKAEGLVTGMAAKMFVIAGPVIVYGSVAAMVYGLIFWISTAI